MAQWVAAVREGHSGSHVPLKVLHAVRTTDLRGGGFVSYVERLREALTGHPVTLLVEAVFPREQRLRVLALRAPWRFYRRVRAACGEVDTLHLHGIFGWHVLLGAWAAWRARRPYVVTLHGHLHGEAMRERYWSKRAYLALIGRRILRRAAAVLVTAPAEAAIAGRYTVAERVRELVPGLPMPPPVPPPEPASPLKLLYIGRMHPHKGLPLLLEALAAARARGLDATLAVAGPGHAHHRRKVEARIAALRLDDCVELLGHVPPQQRDALLQESALLALPSRSENFGFVVAEAMAAGRPVIVSDGVGLADTVRSWNCGLVVPVGDSAALAEALLAYTDPELRARHGQRAAEAAQACFSLQRMGAAAVAIYRDAAATETH